ncbi:hypothetical protein AVEN_90015-1 [Araneus ventricosus]|uniref:Uncharacterized protein n=1 Tax=Araneus ventricosus TaxID=182803 RepID=A0A4Y2DAQ2_ARAVE|nr:hypothetical protein AVEN_90015-1 [Araneus ventricosus]
MLFWKISEIFELSPKLTFNINPFRGSEGILDIPASHVLKILLAEYRPFAVIVFAMLLMYCTCGICYRTQERLNICNFVATSNPIQTDLFSLVSGVRFVSVSKFRTKDQPSCQALAALLTFFHIFYHFY